MCAGQAKECPATRSKNSGSGVFYVYADTVQVEIRKLDAELSAFCMKTAKIHADISDFRMVNPKVHADFPAFRMKPPKFMQTSATSAW
jgi:hypothetical protein